MEHLEGILKLADNELGAIERNGKFRSREEIDSAYKLIDMAKDIYCIWAHEEGGEEDEMPYAGGGSYARGGGRSNRGGSYEGSYEGGSYARGRGRNARRDSRGRYSRNEGSYRGGSYRGYSRADSKEDFIEDLREMMDSAPDDQTRQSIQRMIQQMEQA